MKGYQKLAAFLAVLLFSVGLMSIAIDILGDISDLEFQTGTQPTEGTEAGGEKAETKRGEGQTVKVESAPGRGENLLFEITYPTGTKYLRWTIGDLYEDGKWTPSSSGEWVQYSGEEIETQSERVEAIYFFSVKPFFNLSGLLPGTLNTIRVGGLEGLERNSHLELFSSPTEFDRAYSVSQVIYSFPQDELENAEVTPFEEYLQVPEELKSRLESLATEIVDDFTSPYAKLKALESYLIDNYEYSEEYEKANETDPVEWFLFEERRGVCSQFNSAFILLARSIGIPVRSVGGFSIKPDSNYQLVKQKDAHFWAEARFDGVGWITFDATPPIFEERPQDVTTYPTVTNITYNDPTALKGDKFQVHGTVTLLNGSEVDGLTVEIFLTINKNETDAPCGTGIVKDGFFDISCDANPELTVGDYNLIAHTLPGGIYQESWSDPPIKIITETETTITAPVTTIVGQDFKIMGTLTDKSNGQPVPNATLAVHVGNKTLTLVTDEAGSVSLIHAFDVEGNETIEIGMESSEYYLGSNSSFGIAVKIPPESKPGLFMIITTFPYNVITFTGVAVIVGSILILTRKAERRDEMPQPVVEIFDEEIPRDFEDYKDGVVKLFNWFYAKSRSVLEGIEDSMTPREFQGVILTNIQGKGAPALDYLVTAFEIADYSTSKVGQEMYEKSLTAVELLEEMIQDEQKGVPS